MTPSITRRGHRIGHRFREPIEHSGRGWDSYRPDLPACWPLPLAPIIENGLLSGRWFTSVPRECGEGRSSRGLSATRWDSFRSALRKRRLALWRCRCRTPDSPPSAHVRRPPPPSLLCGRSGHLNDHFEHQCLRAQLVSSSPRRSRPLLLRHSSSVFMDVTPACPRRQCPGESGHVEDTARGRLAALARTPTDDNMGCVPHSVDASLIVRSLLHHRSGKRIRLRDE
jgi:hypothetical protein